MRILHEEREIQEAQSAFQQAIATESQKLDTTISHPAGQIHAAVHWIKGADLWAYFGFPPSVKSSGKRYWSAFGLGKPGKVVSIVCEINSPIRGIDRRPGGAFAEAGDVYLLHRGTFNAFRGRIPRDFIYQNFQGAWVTASDGDRESKLLKIGKLSDQRFIDDLHRFVAESYRVKSAFKG
jgi:hypothetical protein